MLSPTLPNDFSSRLTLAFATFQSVSFSPRSTPPRQILCSHTLADSFSLFALFSPLASFVFNRLRTLCAKHRGWGLPLRHLRVLRACPFFRRASALPLPLFVAPLFSSTYKSLLVAHRFATFSVFRHLQIPFFATPLYSHLYETPRGVGSKLWLTTDSVTPAQVAAASSEQSKNSIVTKQILN